MRFACPLVPATLLRRYKRFLADVRLEDGREVTAHCANPGSMLGLAEEGMRIWVEPNDDPKKKLKFGWRLVEHGGGHFTGVDTGRANAIVREGLEAGRVPELPFESLRAEVKYSDKSRVDFLLEGQTGLTYVEVKSVTLCRQRGLAEFPDSVTARGLKHLGDLSEMVQQGHQAVLFFLVQRTDCKAVSAACDIDPAYAQGLERAVGNGVRVIAYDCEISSQEISLGRAVPMRL